MLEMVITAREADLARTIEAIDAVKAARIHIAAAEPSLFVREDKPATASVMLTLQNGRSLSDGQVQAIRFLVASSVPGMNADQVSVIDQRGALLSDTASGSDMKAFVDRDFRPAINAYLKALDDFVTVQEGLRDRIRRTQPVQQALCRVVPANNVAAVQGKAGHPGQQVQPEL